MKKPRMLLHQRFVAFCMNILYAAFYALLLKVSHSSGIYALLGSAVLTFVSQVWD